MKTSGDIEHVIVLKVGKYAVRLNISLNFLLQGIPGKFSLADEMTWEVPDNIRSSLHILKWINATVIPYRDVSAV